jgi:hypothetical protein
MNGLLQDRFTHGSSKLAQAPHPNPPRGGCSNGRSHRMRKLVILAAGVALVFLQATDAFAMSKVARTGECIRRCYVAYPNNPYNCIVSCIVTDGTHISPELPVVTKPEGLTDIQVGPQAGSVGTGTIAKQSIDQGFTRRLRG